MSNVVKCEIILDGFTGSFFVQLANGNRAGERCFIGDFLRNKQWVYLPKVKVIQILFICKIFNAFYRK